MERGPHQSHHLLERLSLKGHEVRVVDFEIGRRARRTSAVFGGRTAFIAPSKVMEGSNVEVVRPAAVHLPILNYLSVLLMHSLEIRHQFRVFRPDVLLGLGVLNAFIGMRAAKKHRVPFVYYLIDELHRLVHEHALQGFAGLIEEANVQRATLVLAISQPLAAYALEMGSRPDRTRVLPSGVELSRFLTDGDRWAMRKRYDLGERDLVLFFMGWVYPFSGLREIAERLVGGEGLEDNVKLFIVGKGDSWYELLQISRAKGTGERIKVIEFRPYSEMPSYLAAADICLLPAHDVPTMRNIVPIKMYEYLAAAKPVIATRLPGLVKEFGEGNGVVYVNGPNEVLSKASELARKGELRKLGERGRAFVAENDWTTVTQTFESYLAELVQHKPDHD